jgi:hypothetical protein
MPLTGTKGYGKKVVETASEVTQAASSPASAAVMGGKAAARWALDKYRSYTKAKRDKKAADKKAADEKRADELYGKGTTIKPTPKPGAKPTVKKPVTLKSTVEIMKERKRREAQELKDN